MKKMLFAAILSSMTLVGCVVAPPPVIGPAYQTCYVRDLAGRTWNWTGPTPCVQALNACRNWHYNNGIYNGQCFVQ